MPAGGGAEGCVKPRAAINAFPLLSELSEASRGDGESFWAEGDRPGTPTPSLPPPGIGVLAPGRPQQGGCRRLFVAAEE